MEQPGSPRRQAFRNRHPHVCLTRALRARKYSLRGDAPPPREFGFRDTLGQCRQLRSRFSKTGPGPRAGVPGVGRLASGPRRLHDDLQQISNPGRSPRSGDVGYRLPGGSAGRQRWTSELSFVCTNNWEPGPGASDGRAWENLPRGLIRCVGGEQHHTSGHDGSAGSETNDNDTSLQA